VLGVEWRNVQFLHDVGDETGQVVSRQPVMEGKGQQQDLVEIAVSKPFGHARSYEIVLSIVKYSTVLLSSTNS
jgi:hypothetical protein